MRRLFALLWLCLLSSCAWHPCTEQYHVQYCHLSDPLPAEQIHPGRYFLVILVCARHLDYTNGKQLLKTIARHPSDGSKNSDVGHAWVFLQGAGGTLEGGHTGEFGAVQPRYFEGVAELIEHGDPDPIRYLWAIQKDGRFQKGNGGFSPTFAAYIELTQEQYAQIFGFMEDYPYRDYALTGRQCTTFAAAAARMAGLHLEHTITVPIEQRITLGGDDLQLWSDAAYSKITISSPDILEKSLMQAVKEGKAKNATGWYRKRHPKRTTLVDLIRSLGTIPYKLQRARYF